MRLILRASKVIQTCKINYLICWDGSPPGTSSVQACLLLQQVTIPRRGQPQTPPLILLAAPLPSLVIQKFLQSSFVSAFVEQHEHWQANGARETEAKRLGFS